MLSSSSTPIDTTFSLLGFCSPESPRRLAWLPRSRRWICDVPWDWPFRSLKIASRMFLGYIMCIIVHHFSNHSQHHNPFTTSESKRHQVNHAVPMQFLWRSYDVPLALAEAFQDSNRKCLSMFSKRPLPQPEIAHKLTHIFRWKFESINTHCISLPSFNDTQSNCIAYGIVAMSFRSGNSHVLFLQLNTWSHVGCDYHFDTLIHCNSWCELAQTVRRRCSGIADAD